MSETEKAMLLMIAANGEKLNVIAAKLSNESAAHCEVIETDLHAILRSQCPAVAKELGI